MRTLMSRIERVEESTQLSRRRGQRSVVILTHARVHGPWVTVVQNHRSCVT